MLYTVRPLERIYASPDTFHPVKKEKQTEEAEEEYRDIMLPNGRIVARHDGDNYVIERINSTDMKDYLNEDYAPGKNIKY